MPMNPNPTMSTLDWIVILLYFVLIGVVPPFRRAAALGLAVHAIPGDAELLLHDGNHLGLAHRRFLQRPLGGLHVDGHGI